ncbi:ABC transporter substrate-binding protein [Streptomyces varsoviensis]|uniref:Peptide-binding protein n=1 Tax=Streptomyces varsoviensis TaxID=67373 RepID=A0ABR5J1J3_9ACTN|nr:ABC transporter substrate-binding protein [Streptomyces varsoviensis]KOG87245.1 peptide-binding protein [Streptomyces varsoviensis]
MRGGRLWASVLCAAVVAVGAGGCQLVSPDKKDKGPIRVGTTDTITSLDPAGAYDAGSWELFSNLYQSLLTFSPGSDKPVPDAARSCAFQNADLRTYVCELRDGLTFADGREMTAEDVKYSFDRIRRIKSPQGPAPLLTTLTSVQAAGRRVLFHLGVPDATFPFKIATGAGSIVDPRRYPADRLRPDNPDNPVSGSGPYVLKEYAAGSTARLQPNSRYRGSIKSVGGDVTVRFFSSPAKMSRAWRERAVDVVARQMPPTDLAALSPTDDDLRVMENSGAATRSMVFNVRPGSPMKDRAVRQAIAAVVDRETIARDVHHRTVEPLFSLIPRGLTGHSTPFFDAYPKPDPARARALLRDAGITTPVRFDLAYSQGAATGDEAALLREQLEATGLFKVDTHWVEWKKFQEGYAKGEYDAYCVGWLADFPDPDTFIAPLVGADSSLHSGYRDPRVEELIRATEREDLRGRTAKNYRAIQKTIAQDVPMLPLWQKKDYVLSGKSISGTQYLSDGTSIWRLWKLNRI